MILIVSLQSQITIQTESGENRGINVPAYLQGFKPNQIKYLQFVMLHSSNNLVIMFMCIV